MKINDQPYRSIWLDDNGEVAIIDQTRLPHEFRVRTLQTTEDAAIAIRDMWVRGAPLIGATAAWGMALAMREDSSDAALTLAAETLLATRPTAVNLRWAIDAMLARLQPLPDSERAAAAHAAAIDICDADVATNSGIGDNGAPLINALWQQHQRPINILTP
jgi:methylthioribose-1-phosphate isomerase